MSAPLATTDRPFGDASEIERLLAAFEDCSLPKSMWTHRAHLAVALCYCERRSHDQALLLMREGIRRYNEATGGANTETSGYHETITRFYVWLVDHCVRGGKLPKGRPGHPSQRALRQVWGSGSTRERLMSVEARREWVEPDLSVGAADGIAEKEAAFFRPVYLERSCLLNRVIRRLVDPS